MWYVREMIDAFKTALKADGMGNVYRLRQRLLKADWTLAQVAAAERLAIGEWQREEIGTGTGSGEVYVGC
jgi:hypothetical protein